MRQGMEPMKHQRSQSRKFLDATDGSRRRKQARDLWKAQRRERKRQMREW